MDAFKSGQNNGRRLSFDHSGMLKDLTEQRGRQETNLPDLVSSCMSSDERRGRYRRSGGISNWLYQLGSQTQFKTRSSRLDNPGVDVGSCFTHV